MIRSATATPGAKPPIRMAIYTRKSTDENLDDEMNSLEVQRETAEAYIASQKAEGWVALPQRYDDGNCSGGNTDRPAFKRLMADIEAGRVDGIVVYKLDRLSRSILDFAKMMEVFDARGIALVSVTQQFNTSTSLGRLIVHILLSFAQFEREQIAERIRDKMAACRRRGKWVGGSVPLGYAVAPGGGRLVVDEDAAETRRGDGRGERTIGARLDDPVPDEPPPKRRSRRPNYNGRNRCAAHAVLVAFAAHAAPTQAFRPGGDLPHPDQSHLHREGQL